MTISLHSWVENKRIANCCTLRKLCHHLHPLPHFADMESEAHQGLYTWSQRAQISIFIPQSADRGPFPYCRWQNPISSLKSTLRNVSEAPPSPILGPLQWSGQMPFFSGPCNPSLAHSGVSTLLSAFSSMLKRPFSLSLHWHPTSLTSLLYLTAQLLIVWGHAHTHIRAHTPRWFTHVWLYFCGLPWPNSPSQSTWLVPFHAIVTSCDCSPSFHTPHRGLA